MNNVPISQLYKENQLLRTQLGQKQHELTSALYRINNLEQRLGVRTVNDPELIAKVDQLIDENSRLKKKLRYLHDENAKMIEKAQELEDLIKEPDPEPPKKKKGIWKRMLGSLVLRNVSDD